MDVKQINEPFALSINCWSVDPSLPELLSDCRSRYSQTQVQILNVCCR